jgi:hypothetical protein
MRRLFWQQFYAEFYPQAMRFSTLDFAINQGWCLVFFFIGTFSSETDFQSPWLFQARWTSITAGRFEDTRSQFLRRSEFDCRSKKSKYSASGQMQQLRE